MGRARLLVLGLAALGGAVILAWSVERDAGVWWLLGVAVLAGVQLGAAAGAMTHRDRPPRRGVGKSVI